MIVRLDCTVSGLSERAPSQRPPAIQMVSTSASLPNLNTDKAGLPRYPDDLSSIPRANQAAWLERPATPLVLTEVFNRRKNLVTSDLHVLLVTPNKDERVKMKSDLEGLGYKVTLASSGKTAQDMLTDRGGEFHVVMISVALSTLEGPGEGPDCVGLLAWARDGPCARSSRRCR